MVRKRYSDKGTSKVLREIDVHLHDGLDVVSACRRSPVVHLLTATEGHLTRDSWEAFSVLQPVSGAHQCGRRRFP